MSKPRSVGQGRTVESTLVHRVADYESSWDQAPGSWGHSLHSLAPYVGGFPPELAHFFIRKYTTVGDTVLDPFAGGGTTPLEAAIHNRKVLASDKFTYATCLTAAKCNPISDKQFKQYLDEKLDEASKISEDFGNLLDNSDLKTFYSEYTLDKLLRLREVLSDDQSPEATYLNAHVCGVLHGPNERFLSLQTKDTYSGSKSYVEKYAEKHNLTKPERDLRPKIIQNHNLAQDDYIPPWLPERAIVRQGGSRNIPFGPDKADLLLTSPPYLSKLDYTWNNWIRLWWLGVDRKTEQNELDMTQDIEAYREFMRDSLKEIDRVLKEDAVAVIVVGDVVKRLANHNEVINIASLIREEALEHTNFEYENTIIDDYGIDGRSFVTANQTKYEYDDEKRDEMTTVDRCLVLTKGTPDTNRSPNINWSLEPYQRVESQDRDQFN